jgi:hypothetical protein
VACMRKLLAAVTASRAWENLSCLISRKVVLIGLRECLIRDSTRDGPKARLTSEQRNSASVDDDGPSVNAVILSDADHRRAGRRMR